MYHVAVDNQVPYWIYSNMQDDGTMRGAEHDAGAGAQRAVVCAPAAADGRGGGGGGGGRRRRAAAAVPWEQGIGGCESGFTIPDPAIPTSSGRPATATR